jgi:hypothetical protein
MTGGRCQMERAVALVEDHPSDRHLERAGYVPKPAQKVGSWLRLGLRRTKLELDHSPRVRGAELPLYGHDQPL